MIVHMDRTSILILATFSIVLVGWPLHIYYHPNLQLDFDRSPFLWNDTAGKQINPKDIEHYDKIFLNNSDYHETTSPAYRLYDIIFHENLLHLLVGQHEYSKHEDLIVSSKPVGNETKCRQEIESTLKLIESNPNYHFSNGKLNHQITKYLDSFGKPKPRTFSGSHRWVGSYLGCLSSNVKEVKMRYCWTRWRFNQWPRDIDKMNPRTYINVGACLPESCDSRAIVASRDNIRRLVTSDWAELYRNNMALHELYCLPDERSPLRTLGLRGYVFIGLVVLWLTIVIVATSLHQKKKRDRESGEAKATNGVKLAVLSKLLEQTPADKERVRSSCSSKLLESLSFIDSFKKLTRDRFKTDYKHSDSEEWPLVDLGCTNAMKSLMYAGIVFGHAAFFGSMYHGPIEEMANTVGGLSGAFFVSFGNLVSTFYMITGLLSGYMLTAHIGRAPFWKVWLGFNSRAAIKILPTYYLVFAYAKLISPYLGEGPLWDYGTTKFSRREMCSRENWNRWLYPIGVTIVDPCVLPAWFLGVYFQLCLIIPLVAYLFTKLPSDKLRLFFVAFCSLSSSSMFNIRLAQQKSIDVESFSTYNGLLAELTLRFEKVASYEMMDQFGLAVIGCYIGNLLHRYNAKQIRRWPEWLESRITFVLMLVLNPVLLCVQMLSYLSHELTGRYATLLDIMIGNSVVAKLAWPIASGLLIILCSTTYKHLRVVRIFSHSFWFTFNRLGLVIFLMHWEFLEIVFSWTDLSLNENYWFFLIVSFIFAYVMCLLVAVPFHILFEVPMSESLGILYGRLMEMPARLLRQRKLSNHT